MVPPNGSRGARTVDGISFRGVSAIHKEFLKKVVEEESSIRPMLLSDAFHEGCRFRKEINRIDRSESLQYVYPGSSCESRTRRFRTRLAGTLSGVMTVSKQQDKGQRDSLFPIRLVGIVLWFQIIHGYGSGYLLNQGVEYG